MLTKKKDIYLLIKIMGIAIVLFILLMFFWNSWKEKIYPFATYEQFISGKIEEVKPYQSVAYVKLKSGEMFRLTSARNYDYEPYDLNRFLRNGDKIYKEAGNDSLHIVRNNQTYIFVLAKDINK